VLRRVFEAGADFGASGFLATTGAAGVSFFSTSTLE